MADGVLVGSSGISVNASGVIVDAAGTACCCDVIVDCSDTTYCATLPSSISVSDFSSVWANVCGPTGCGGSPNVTEVLSRSGCIWATFFCFQGFSGTTGISCRVVHDAWNSGAGPARFVWILAIGTIGIFGVDATTQIEYMRPSASGILGTYTLWRDPTTFTPPLCSPTETWPSTMTAS